MWIVFFFQKALNPEGLNHKYCHVDGYKIVPDFFVFVFFLSLPEVCTQTVGARDVLGETSVYGIFKKWLSCHCSSCLSFVPDCAAT